MPCFMLKYTSASRLNKKLCSWIRSFTTLTLNWGAMEVACRHSPYPEYNLVEGQEHLPYQEYFVEGRDTSAEGQLFIAVVEVDLASSVVELARHVHRTGLRQVSAEQVDLVFELMGIVQSVAESPLIPSRSATDDDSLCLKDPNPKKYADALFLLARDMANPLGAFGFVHPTKYLPFLQQLAGDLMNQSNCL